MYRIASFVRASGLVIAPLLLATASSARAQAYVRPPRAEITPFGGYQWGGSFSTDALGSIPSGKIEENDSFSWGIVLSFLAQRHSAAELYYLRQPTSVTFKRNAGSTDVGDFSNNYIQLGFRQEIQTANALRPFITASLGVNVLDPSAADLGTSTRFAWSLGGGALVMPPEKRVGFRLDIRWMVTPVPSGTYGGWCDIWGCYAVSGTTWLHQGQASGGLVVAF
jgi:hypothetical protein